MSCVAFGKSRKSRTTQLGDKSVIELWICCPRDNFDKAEPTDRPLCKSRGQTNLWRTNIHGYIIVSFKAWASDGRSSEVINIMTTRHHTSCALRPQASARPEFDQNRTIPRQTLIPTPIPFKRSSKSTSAPQPPATSATRFATTKSFPSPFTVHCLHLHEHSVPDTEMASSKHTLLSL